LKNQILNFQNFLLLLSKAVQRYNKFFKLPNFFEKKVKNLYFSLKNRKFAICYSPKQAIL